MNRNPLRLVAVLSVVLFGDCTFVQWGFKDREEQGERRQTGKERVQTAAIQSLGGNLIVRGCEFQDDMPQILLGEKTRKAVITGNLIRGAERIENKAGEKTSIVIRDNAADVDDSPKTLRSATPPTPFFSVHGAMGSPEGGETTKL